jgi:hypothetical protein
VELEAERASELAGVGAKWQAGTVDPGMEAPKMGSRCRREKGRHERLAPIERQFAASLEALNLRQVKRLQGS